MTRWLSIVGIGEDGLAALSPCARSLIDEAEVLVGGERHLAMLPPDNRERLTWSRPLQKLADSITTRRDRRVCVLATGDPMWFGIGVTLAKHVPTTEMTIVPAPSAFALACARLGWPLSEVETVTLHGRPLELVLPAFYPGARILALSDGAETPGQLAALLCAQGYGGSHMTVLEHMGGSRERRREATAESWNADDVAAFNTVAIDCVAAPGASPRSRLAGLPDDAFEHDGQMTKREVRAATLAALSPIPGQRLWDVGAGCGSVAIEWMRADPRCTAMAVERHAARRDLMARNAVALGVPGLRIVAGEAPEALADLPHPDAVFIGGGLSRPDLLERCWQALASGGRLVANAVTVESEAALLDWYGRQGGNLTRIQISRAEQIGAFSGWRPAMPVTQFAAVKA